MGLAAFIRSNEDAIIAEWQAFAQTYLPSAEHMDRAALRDHVVGLLRFIADDLETPETERERSEKSKGRGLKEKGRQDAAAATHGDLRFAAGFDTVEMISEFRALRASVIKLWRSEWTKIDNVLPDLLRFNESIDQIMTESLSRFIEKFKYSTSQIIGTLVNDIHDPLLATHDSIKLLLENNKLVAEDAQSVSQIVTTVSRVNGFVSNVIDAVCITPGNDGVSAPPRIDNKTSARKAAKEIQADHLKTESRS